MAPVLLCEHRRNKPRNGLVSVFANARIDGEPWANSKPRAYCPIAACTAAGHETTREAIGGGLHALIENPQQRAR